MLTSECLRQISLEAVRSVHPTSLVRPYVQLCRPNDVDKERYVVVNVGGTTFKVDVERGCRVVGFGKAVLGMGAELNRWLFRSF